MRIYVRGPLSLISHKLYESNSNGCFNKYIFYIQAVSVCVYIIGYCGCVYSRDSVSSVTYYYKPISDLIMPTKYYKIKIIPAHHTDDP